MNSFEVGAKLIAYGVASHFKPWYFDGKIVYWGNAEETKADALASAQRMKDSFTTFLG